MFGVGSNWLRVPSDGSKLKRMVAGGLLTFC